MSFVFVLRLLFQNILILCHHSEAAKCLSDSVHRGGQLENTETRERIRERKQPKDVENVSQFRGHTLAKSPR